MTQELEETNHSIVLFSVGSEVFGLSIEHVIEIIRPETPYKLPLAPPSIDGLINVRDCIFPLINFEKLFDVHVDKTNPDDERMILVTFGDTSFAIYAHRIVELTTYTPSQLLSKDVAKKELERSSTYIEDVLKLPDGLSVHLLALQPLIDTLKEEAALLATT